MSAGRGDAQSTAVGNRASSEPCRSGRDATRSAHRRFMVTRDAHHTDMPTISQAEADALLAQRSTLQQEFQAVMHAYRLASGAQRKTLKTRLQEVQRQLELVKPKLRAWGEQCHADDRAGIERSKRELVGRLLRWRDELRDRARNPKSPPAERHFADQAGRRLDDILGPLHEAPTVSADGTSIAPPSAPAKAVLPATDPVIAWKPMTARVKGVYGDFEVALTADQTRAYQMGDQLGAATAALGVTVAEYQEWLEWRGFVHCCARTKAGKTCRNLVLAAPTQSVQEWAERMRVGELCATHGGLR